MKLETLALAKEIAFQIDNLQLAISQFDNINDYSVEIISDNKYCVIREGSFSKQVKTTIAQMIEEEIKILKLKFEEL